MFKILKWLHMQNFQFNNIEQTIFIKEFWSTQKLK